jgi:hypothetical protein
MPGLPTFFSNLPGTGTAGFPARVYPTLDDEAPARGFAVDAPPAGQSAVDAKLRVSTVKLFPLRDLREESINAG